MKLLRPIEFLYHLVSDFKNFLYDSGLLKSNELAVPVVSIGNISFGGTGKTPHVIFLAKELSKNKRVAVVCRSYKTILSLPQKIDLKKTNCAEIFGDEACLLQQELPNCSVWCGPDKSQTATACLEDKPEVIIVDDGFSHRKLKKNVDVLLVHAVAGFSDYTREFIGNIKRAKFIILTNSQKTTELELSLLKNEIIKISPELKDFIFLSQSLTGLSLKKQTPLFVFCGIARPQNLREELEKEYRVVDFLSFADHHKFSENEQKSIYEKFIVAKKNEPELEVVCTAKDFVKITNINLKKSLKVIDLKIQVQRSEVLFEKIRQAL